jgi:hypothetical protein
MAKSVVLSDILVDEWTVNLNLENVTVRYRVVDDAGKTWINDEAIFWRNIPVLTDPDGNPTPVPDRWYQLPLAYLPTLLQMASDITTAMKTKLGI